MPGKGFIELSGQRQPILTKRRPIERSAELERMGEPNTAESESNSEKRDQFP